MKISRGLLPLSVLTLGTIALTGQSSSLFSASPLLDVGVSGSPSALIAADVNGDARPDLILGTCDGGRCTGVSVLLGRGDGTFAAPAAYGAGGDGANAIAVADVNRDGAQDLLVANANSNTIGILLGNGAGAFQPAIQLSALTAGSSRPMAIAAGDLDGDGIADLVVANERMEHDLAMPIGVWVGLGDGTFASPRDYASAGGSPRSIRIADINRDRLPDLVVLNAASLDEPDRGSVGIFLGKGGGFFSPAAAYATTLRLPHSASIADLNDDGSPDIVVSHSETRDVDVLLGRSDGSLSNARRIGSGAGSGTVNRSNPLALADVNGDSHVDALLGTCFGGGCAGELQVLPGDGRGGFHAAVNEPAGAFGVGLIAVAELNGDGRAHPVVATCSDSQCGRAAIQVLLLQQSSDTPQITAAAGSLDTQRLESSSVSATNISEEGTGVPAVSMPGGATYNIRLVSDASPDVTDLAGLIHSTTSRWTSVREKVWALFYWTHVLKRQTAPIVRHGFEITDPVRNFLDYGYTMCSTISGINQTLYESLGLPHQYWDVCNHTVSTVYYDGKFRMVDSSMSHLVTSDGMNLASLQEAAANSARLVQTQSLYSTSPFGFLTGSDTMRNLSDFTNPSGGVVQGFSRAFCESGLKHRDYYHNWNNGHRHVLNLREDETYTRYYRRLGSANAYWISSESVSSPDPNKTFEIDAENRFGLRGNGQWIFTPKLSPDRYAQAVYQATNIAAVPEGGLTALTTGQDAHVVYKVQAANAIASQVVHARFRISDATAAAAIAVSVNHGATWISVGSVGSTTGESVPVDIALRDQVNGAYETLVRIEMRDGGSPSSIVLTGLTIETITQVNAKALPKLNVGRNEIYLGAGDQSDTLVLWPDLRGALWQRDVYASANIATQDVSVPRKYTAVAYPSSLLTDAHLTYRMEAPTDITRLVYGGRLHNFKAGSYIDFLHSFDGGATWIHSYRLTDVAAPYDDIHYETVTNIPAGVRSVLFKFLIHNTSTDVTRASGLYSVRMEVNHQPKTSVLRPLDVTWRWKEVRPDRTLLERSHRQRVSAFPFTYVVNVGGSDHPVMESVTVNVENEADTSPFGYSDGIDAGGQKYAYTRRTDGTNVAKDRPYTVSRTPSGFQSSAAASNTTILTDGVVGAPASGAISYWWGQCWSSGTLVELQVDLGAERSVSAFRAHLLGYPWWDALKGQVKDQVEILTSLDGINFSSQGVLQTSLWKKDLPINHMLLDDEKATAWNFERLVPAPVTTRYVKYRVTPKRDLCVSELQVIDQVLDEPFDIQIALPASGETTGSPANVAPAVALTRPAADTNFVPPATIDLEASASDSDGTISRVDFFAGATLVGTATASPYTVTWADVPDGTYLLTARATDNAGASTTSAGVTITVQTSPPPAPGVLDEIVVHAAPSAQIGGGWSIVPDSTAASGARLQNPNTGQPKLSTALANPAESFEASFEADAGKGYRIWVRGKALNDDYTNDSVFLQFDRSVDATGTPIWRIGTTTATSVILEECGGCGLKGWGWTDNGYGTDGPLVYFAESGPQRLRIQMREDGLGIDQVVLSAVQYKTTAPGATKNDTTILPATSAAPPPPNAAPAVALTAPTADMSFVAPATVNLAASASDPDGTIARVEFYAGTTLIGQSTANPYTSTWTGVPAGTYTLTARAIDDAGASTTSATVAITVDASPPPPNAAPAVALTAPTADMSFVAPATVNLAASASDSDGTIARVEFYAGTTLIGQSTANPYTTTWTGVPAGAYALTARAIDDAGASTTSATVAITVDAAPPPPNAAPAVSLTAPTADMSFVAPATVNLAASASDPDGTIARVEFYAGTTLIGQSTANPYTTTWTGVPEGTYALTARALDNAGASATSAGVTITVQAAAAIPPRASIDEIVIHAAPSAQIGGGWSVVADTTAAGGARVQNANAGRPKLSKPLANPAEFFEVSFDAEAGKGYRIWLRGKALNDDYNNDSVFLQFDRSVDANGTAVWRLGTTSATSVILEDCNGCGLKGWGWADNGSGTNGALVYFAESGPQRLRIQMREDGLGIDQIVLSAVQYKTTAPGATKNDTTILPATSGAPAPGNAPPAAALTAPAADTAFVAPATVNLEASASDSDGTIARVEFYAGTALIGQATTSPYAATWTNVAAGTYTLTAHAIDNAGASTASASVTIAVQTSSSPPPVSVDEVVLHAGASAEIIGGWSVVADSTAASGARVQNPDGGQKLSTALANPAQVFELSFTADAGKPYRIWLRGKALKDKVANDSVFLQFDRSVDATGAAVWRIGTAAATPVVLEECSGCGVKGWGWADNGYGTNGPLVYFAESGPQRLRIQMAEDGLGIDQVVLSASKYLTTAPGPAKNDTTIVPR